MRSAVARIMRSRAHVLSVFKVILLRNKVAFECQTCAKLRKIVPASICVSRDYVSVNARNRIIARKASAARMAFASSYVTAIVIVYPANCVSTVRAKQAALQMSAATATKCALTASAGISLLLKSRLTLLTYIVFSIFLNL